ncbi:hypothetical protein CC80DRAFT_599511 [Byssothecium circinans]|uniref:Uncharacterized protein n=1 Tax=Byssothecium circinans TaxID=147558 RepID=A0A6A5TAJ1_9PLEO|nr:hypothetical protein CC80DRAFT_599511 [Byssothecium circinans]
MSTALEGELPTPGEICQAYFGTTNMEEMQNIMEELELGDGSHLAFSDDNFDTGLFPYQAEGPLEAPIPTPAEILAAKPAGLDSYVWRVGPYIVKVGGNAKRFQEAENLLYLERNSTVRTPKLYAAFMSAEVDVFSSGELSPDKEPKMAYYIVMEYIDGMSLSKAFREAEKMRDEGIDGTSLSEMLREGEKTWDEGKELPMCDFEFKITQLAAEQLRKLRSVPPEDPNHFGRVNGGAFNHLQLIYNPPDRRNWGPFDYEGFVSRMVHSSKIFHSYNGCDEDFSDVAKSMYRHAKQVFLDMAGPSDRVPVLSHLDVHKQNMVVKVTRDEEGTLTGVEEVVIIDWEWMAWVPPWFEAAEMMRLSLAEDEACKGLGISALHNMGKVNMAIVCFLGIGFLDGIFRAAHH